MCSPTSPGAGTDQFERIWNASSEKPDALLVLDDNLLLDATVCMIRRRIKCPDELLVVSQTCKGGTPVVPVPVARLEVDPSGFAAVMVEMIMRLIRRESLERKTVKVEFNLVEP